MKDGFLNKCKDCQKQSTLAARNRNPERYREYDRARSNLPHRVAQREEYQKTDAYKASHAKSLKRQKELNPLKTKARYAVSNAIRRGTLIAPNECSACGFTAVVHAHHDDYSKPLDVRWLCIPCHVKHHKENP